MRMVEDRHSKVFVFIMLFAVLGPFGLPFLWKSEKFTGREKYFWTFVTSACTVLLIGLIIILIKLLIKYSQALIGY